MALDEHADAHADDGVGEEPARGQHHDPCGVPIASDPFGLTWDLFGTAGYEFSITIFPYLLGCGVIRRYGFNSL